jgi:hypothetical protein
MRACTAPTGIALVALCLDKLAQAGVPATEVARTNRGAFWRVLAQRPPMTRV